ncbi:MAG: hypothetical protein E5V52_04065 [Mesorhizobium sp.]|nr:MAG: hypothetical protein E5W35_05630 [Mesorhizobium sp.]TIW87445.1 MAG: hypothetical protein E5V52_04065 [Mesorhizobium sp.]
MLRALVGVADADQLAALSKLMAEFEKETGISEDDEARRSLAERIMALFNRGVTEPEEIRRRLDAGRAQG